MEMYNMLDWLFRKHKPTGNTEKILVALGSVGPDVGYNQAELSAFIEEPEYVLRGMMDVLVDLQYVRMERRGSSKVYYYV